MTPKQAQIVKDLSKGISGLSPKREVAIKVSDLQELLAVCATVAVEAVEEQVAAITTPTTPEPTLDA